MHRTILTLAFLTALLPAQRPASWVPIDLPAPIATASINQLGKTLAYAGVNQVWFFSGFARKWETVNTIVAQPITRVFNDMALVVDTGRIIAFSSYRGTIEILPVSANAAILNPGAQRNDSIILVQDGSTLWSFSAFIGSWSQRTLTTASPVIATQRHVAIVAEGTALHGMSAFDGVWVAHTATAPITAASADGSWGVAESATDLYGFSAQRKTWSTTPALTAPVTTVRREDCIVYWNNVSATAYTGLRGVFATAIIPGLTTVVADAITAGAQAGLAVHFYSAVLGQWSQMQTNVPAAMLARPHLISVNDGGTLTAYSPFLGTHATLPAPAASDTGNAGVAAAVTVGPNAQLYLYSPLTGQWTAAPAGTPPVLPNTTWNGALVNTPGSYSAYSGRTGQFFPLPVTATATFVDGNSSVMAIEDATRLYIFEPRRETWLSVAKVNAAPLTVSIWRTTLLAVDGATVHGFGTFAGEIESFALPAPPTESGANSESLRAGVGSRLAAFGGTPDLVTLYQFPEFRRIFVVGSTLELQLHGAPSSAALAFLGRRAASPINVPPLGTLLLDPLLLLPLPLGALPADGRVRATLAVPDDPSLLGSEVFFQGVVVPPAGTPYLTRMASVGLH
jgi:hypothetical protein